jgi:putative oxidoreductase
MNDNNGKLILRVTLGFLILLHGIAKLRNGIDPIGDALAASGLPVIFKYGVYIGEVIAPVLLILGYYARIGAWLIAVNMLFAIGLAHWGEVFLIDGQSGGLALEKQYLFMLSAIALGLMGPGRLAINQQ